MGVNVNGQAKRLKWIKIICWGAGETWPHVPQSFLPSTIRLQIPGIKMSWLFNRLQESQPICFIYDLVGHGGIEPPTY